MPTGQRTYDIKEFSEKALEALKRLEQHQKPGQALTGGKKDVLLAVKDEIKALMGKGYSAQQIAEAFQQDVFGILPKTITELIDGSKKSTRKAKASEGNSTASKTMSQPVAKVAKAPGTTPKEKNKESQAGSFEVKPDRDDI